MHFCLQIKLHPTNKDCIMYTYTRQSRRTENLILKNGITSICFRKLIWMFVPNSCKDIAYENSKINVYACFVVLNIMLWFTKMPGNIYYNFNSLISIPGRSFFKSMTNMEDLTTVVHISIITVALTGESWADVL